MPSVPRVTTFSVFHCNYIPSVSRATTLMDIFRSLINTGCDTSEIVPLSNVQMVTNVTNITSVWEGVHLQCADGYDVFHGNTQRICNPFNTWDGEQLWCVNGSSK